jgi:hypothetical protein
MDPSKAERWNARIDAVAAALAGGAKALLAKGARGLEAARRSPTVKAARLSATKRALAVLEALRKRLESTLPY